MSFIAVLKLPILFLAGVLTSTAIRSSNRVIGISTFLILNILAASIITNVVHNCIMNNVNAINEPDWILRKEYEEKIARLEDEVTELEEKNNELEQKNTILGDVKNLVAYVSGLFTPSLTELVGDGMRGIRKNLKRKKKGKKKAKKKKRKKKNNG